MAQVYFTTELTLISVFHVIPTSGYFRTNRISVVVMNLTTTVSLKLSTLALLVKSTKSAW